jgi:hypothetical protein
MNEMFKKAIADGDSDIHIKAGDFVRARVDGELVPLTNQKISHTQVRELALKLIPHEHDRARIDDIMDYDCAWGLPGLGRFRYHDPETVRRSVDRHEDHSALDSDVRRPQASSGPGGDIQDRAGVDPGHGGHRQWEELDDGGHDRVHQPEHEEAHHHAGESRRISAS